MKQLVIFKDNYADEFDVESFAITDSDEMPKLFGLVNLYFEFFPKKELELYFGTNEALIFEDYESFHRCFTIHNISEQETNVFYKFFPTYLPNQPIEFGTSPGIFDLNFITDEFFELHDSGELSEEMIDKIIEIEPEFEDWIKQ